MLNRIEWDKSKVQADVFSLDGLIAWLEKQPAERVYDWHDIEGCLMFQYFRASGFKMSYCGATQFTHRRGFWIFAKFVHEKVSRALTDVSAQGPHSFGAALERARKRASSPVRP